MALTDADWIKIVGITASVVGLFYATLNKFTSAIAKVGHKIEELRDELAQSRWEQRIAALERREIVAAADIHAIRNYLAGLSNIFIEKQVVLETLFYKFEERARLTKKEALEELERINGNG